MCSSSSFVINLADLVGSAVVYGKTSIAHVLENGESVSRYGSLSVSKRQGL